MDDEIRTLRAAVGRVQQGKPPRAVRYPAVVRRKITTLARRQHAQGVDVTSIASALGIAPWTLALWLRDSAPAVTRPVAVVAETAPRAVAAVGEPVLITPRGLRVEGLDRETLVAVLGALG